MTTTEARPWIAVAAANLQDKQRLVDGFMREGAPAEAQCQARTILVKSQVLLARAVGEYLKGL